MHRSVSRRLFVSAPRLLSSPGCRLVGITAVGLMLSVPAYGYIDPGTGSLIIQSIIGAIAAIGVTMKIYWHKIKLFFLRRSEAADTSKKPADENNP